MSGQGGKGVNRAAQDRRFRTEEWRPGDLSSVLIIPAGALGGSLIGNLVELLFVGTY